MKTKWLFILLAGTLLLSIQGCKDDAQEEMQGTSPMRVRMTDSPADYEEVNINVQEVWVHADNGNGWTALHVNKGMYNLLDFTAGIDTLIASGDIPSGQVSQIRLVLGDGNNIRVNGTVYPLSTPSAEQSGLKLQIHANLVRDVPYTILLDFDASKSILQTGNGTYKLKPVIRCILVTEGGGISGMVIPSFPRTAVMAIKGVDTFGTYTDFNGNFLIKGLSSGNYQVWFDANAPQQDTTIDLLVTAGSIYNMGIIQLDH